MAFILITGEVSPLSLQDFSPLKRRYPRATFGVFPYQRGLKNKYQAALIGLDDKQLSRSMVTSFRLCNPGGGSPLCCVWFILGRIVVYSPRPVEVLGSLGQQNARKVFCVGWVCELGLSRMNLFKLGLSVSWQSLARFRRENEPNRFGQAKY